MNCIIIEDEVLAQDILKMYLEKIPEMEIKGVFNSPLLANSILKEIPIDVLFLDINLPNISGINYLKTLTHPPKVIMTTAYANYAAESFEHDTIVDYLVKPFSFERFLKAINKLQNQIVSPKIVEPIPSEIIARCNDAESVFVNVDKTLHKVNLEEIMYVQSDRNYVTVITKNNKLSFIDTLKNWNEYLKSSNFVQVHKSYIVNIQYVDKVMGNLVFVNDEKIPVGRLYKEQLFKAIKPIN